MPGQGICSKSQVRLRHTRNVLDASYNLYVFLVLRDSCWFLRGIFLQALQFFPLERGVWGMFDIHSCNLTQANH